MLATRRNFSRLKFQFGNYRNRLARCFGKIRARRKRVREIASTGTKKKKKTPQALNSLYIFNSGLQTITGDLEEIEEHRRGRRRTLFVAELCCQFPQPHVIDFQSVIPYTKTRRKTLVRVLRTGLGCDYVDTRESD